MIRRRGELERSDRHRAVLDALEAGVHAAHPRAVIDRTLTVNDGVLDVGDETVELDAFENVYVLGGGNAGGQVAAALEDTLADYIEGGVVVTDDPATTDRIDIVEGTHPLPSAANVEGTRALLAVADSAGPNDLVITIISGGGSALMCAPDSSVPLSDYRDLTQQLLESGANIDEINAVRKHVSAFKGGRLATHVAPAATLGLVFSDVVGNPLDVIASGPISPDPSTYADFRSVVDGYDLELSEPIRTLMEEGLAGERAETPGADDPVFETVSTHVLADGRTALTAAKRALEAAGYDATVLAAEIEGEASDVGGVHARIAAECANYGEPAEPPVAFVSGGETTVTVDGDGQGGPNQEFALGAALAISDRVVIGAIDTDGIDGRSDVAGAIVDAETVTATEQQRARTALRRNDAYGYLAEADCLIETGATGTNVNDLRIVLVGEPAQ